MHIPHSICNIDMSLILSHQVKKLILMNAVFFVRKPSLRSAFANGESFTNFGSLTGLSLGRTTKAISLKLRLRGRAV